MKVRKMRLLRQKYGITLIEIGSAAGVSKQRVSELELSDCSVTTAVKDRITRAFSYICEGRLSACRPLQDAFARHRDSLFDYVESDYEL